MKKKIIVLGSTGSIGKSLLNIIKRDKKNFKIILLTARKNYQELLKQAKIFNVKNLIITDEINYNIAKKKNNNKKINIYNNFNNLNKILRDKVDYTMNSIVGIEGLIPTIKIIKFTKKIAIANKETIICAWNLIKKELKKNKTEFIPVDSEHFSIWYALNKTQASKIEKIYLTASGGPLLNIPILKYKKVKISEVLKHPNWKMGKKITVDSATMMNKVFEIVEAKKIFNIPYEKLSILVHPKSYIHAIVKFNNGLIKIIAHDTTMEIPIFNSIYGNMDKKISSKVLDISKLNNLKLSDIDVKKFPLTKIISTLPKKNSLFETVIVSANDELVNLFLKRKIKYNDISTMLLKIINKKEFIIFKNILPKKVSDIVNLNKYVRFKINSMGV